jgi:crotonobetainyl-CoA:carnitine CoA-transferase CaiB-like acyl-CoA transferase
MAATAETQKLPLDGVRVLELSHIVAGPSAGVILADLGADVIKIEHPAGGDTSRNKSNDGATFFTYNRNKKYLSLDLREGAGREIFEKLVARSDVVLDNFAPGALDRLGLGYDWGREINRGIIYCSIRGFLPGPYNDRPFLDELAQMAGGLAYLTGFKDQPMRAGASITDIGAATYGVVGILAALYRRTTTGEGDRIEAGLYETVVFWISQHLTRAQTSGKNPPPRGSRDSGMGTAMGWGVYQLFSTKEGRQVFIAVTGNRHWEGLCDVLGFADWKHSPEFNSNGKRSREKARIAARVTEAVAKFTYDDITERLYTALVPFAPVNTPLDLINEKHLNEGMRWLPVKAAEYDVKVPKLPFDMARTRPFSVRQQPSCLGEDTDSILEELGYSPAAIAALKEKKIVRRATRMLDVDQE